MGIPEWCLQPPATGEVEIGHENGLCYNEFNESSFSPALPALIPVPTVHFQPVFWQGHCSVTAGWSCTWTLCAAPASSPQHIPGAASHRCPGMLREGPFPPQGWSRAVLLGELLQVCIRCSHPGARGKAPSQSIPGCPDRAAAAWGAGAVTAEAALSDTAHCMCSAARRRLFPEEN